MRTPINILALGLMTAIAMADDPTDVKPTQIFKGGDSMIHKPMVRMIADAVQWKELWNMHKGIPALVSDKGVVSYPATAPAPPVFDFAKNQILVVFGGKLPDVQNYDYVKTYAKDKTAVIQISQNFLPPSAAIPAAPFTPFLMMVIPREPFSIEVELDSLAKDGSHFWLKIAAFRAPKTAPVGG